jgi:hypothetical protein
MKRSRNTDKGGRRRELRLLGFIPRCQEPKEASREPSDEIAAKADAAARALFEIFSDPKGQLPPRNRWLFDAARQQFVRDPIDLMLQRKIKKAFGVEDEDAALDEPRPLPPDSQ